MGAHPDNRLDSWRTGLIVLAVALLAGYLGARFIHRGDEEPVLLNLARPAMGTLVEVQVLRPQSTDELPAASAALGAALTEVARVDSLFSRSLPDPESMRPEEREAERNALIETGIEVWRESGGAFDPRIASLIDAWGFEDGEGRVPSDEEIAALLAEMNVPNSQRPEDFDTQSEQLHFGAWAKGYAVDRACEVLRNNGRTAALVNAGGDICGFGRDWTVGIQHPRLPGALIARLRPGNLAVATSGDYEQYFERNGVRYHHLLDPRTGRPARGCRSVTVLAATCARADALATAIFVLGPDEGMELTESLSGVESLIIDADGERHESTGLGVYLVEN